MLVYNDPMTLLQRFVDVFEQNAKHDKTVLNVPGLEAVYQDMRAALDWHACMHCGSARPMRITHWLCSGELGEQADVPDLLYIAGRVLDKSGATDCCGTVVFTCEDGVDYVLTVEGVISPADPGFVQDIRDELAFDEASVQNPQVKEDEDGDIH